MPMRMTQWLSAAVVSSALLFSTAAFAGGDPNDAYSSTATFDLQARNQPLGAVIKMQFYNEYEFMRGNVSPFFDPVWLRGAANVNVSPGYAEAGIEMAISPIRLFEFRVGYMATYYFGSLYYIFSFDEADIDRLGGLPAFDDDGVDVFQENENGFDEEESGYAHRIYVEPTLQAALGNIAFQNKFTYIRSWHPSDQFDGDFVREPIFDRILQTDGDNIFANSLTFLYKVWDPDGDGAARMLVGPMHEWVKSTGLQDETGFKDIRHRLGLTYVLIPKANYGKLLIPRLVLQAGYNLVDRDNNREGHIFIQGGIGFNLQLVE